LVLAARTLIMIGIGTAQTWGFFAKALQEEYAGEFNAFRTQIIFTWMNLMFCLMLVPAGRLHDRFGPVRTAVGGALLLGLAYGMAWRWGAHFGPLWLSLGLILSTGIAIVYVCPLATAIKWFPQQRGLASGLTAAGFAAGPIILNQIAESLNGGGFKVLEIFGFIAVVYTPLIITAALTLRVPAGDTLPPEAVNFRIPMLLPDRRFWTLWLGMLFGTLPYLIVMGSAKQIATDYGLAPNLILYVIPAIAAGNLTGRVLWGLTADRFGARAAMHLAQVVLLAASVTLLVLMARESQGAGLFYASVIGLGFCYGSNFAIYPAAVARIYGPHLVASIYPLIMVAQGLGGFAAMLNGYFRDVTGSYVAGIALAAGLTVLGMLCTGRLSRSLGTR
jgi:OFA family oxalate/formate antiporter-like MFS transporter